MAVAAPIGAYRRGKTVLFLAACGWAGVAPHWIDPARGLLPGLTLALFLGGYGLRVVLRGSTYQEETSALATKVDHGQLPKLDLIVAARDEEAVVTRLVERLGRLRYTPGRLTTWVVDDGSEDCTPILLEKLQCEFPCLQVLHRTRDAGGGKSGALNAALTQCEGEWLLVLDADAQLQEDLLERLLPFALEGGWSAVQLRKAVTNADASMLTQAQAMEMAFDALIQQGRLATGGVTELRGNGQLLRRDVIEACGGFNEETVTDDLDLSFRLLIDGIPIGVLWNPPVQEEAVETWAALWRQRQRWAEGGLQRFLDYWPQLLSSRLTLLQRCDLASFFLLQYALPVISLSDLAMSLLSHSLPLYWPLSLVAFSISGLAFWRGCRSNSEGPTLPVPGLGPLLFSILYLTHWFVVIPWVSLRMALLPKRLVWAKTDHNGEVNLSSPSPHPAPGR